MYLSCGPFRFQNHISSHRSLLKALGMLAGSLLLSGCGAYLTKGSAGEMYSSSPVSSSGKSSGEAQLASAGSGSQGQGTAMAEVPVSPLSAAGEPGEVPAIGSRQPAANPEVKAAMVGWGHLSNPMPIDSNSLGRLRNRFEFTPKSLTCASVSILGSGAVTCTVTLSSPAPNGGEAVTVASSNSNVAVPATVTVPAKATSVAFTATVLAVSSAQTATLTASTNTGAVPCNLQLNAVVSTLIASTTSVNFGNVASGQIVTQSVVLSSTGTEPVTISGIAIVGSLFTASGVTVPTTLNPGLTATMTLQFSTTQVSTFTGILTVTSNSSQGNIVVNMGAVGLAAPAMSAVTCGSAAMTGAGSDACTVKLTAAAPTGGLSVSLASNNAAVTVPATVTVAANATSASFTAAVAAVNTSQTAIITAKGGGASGSFSVQLSPVIGTLAVNATSVSFGSVPVSSPATQSITLSSVGSAAVTVNSASVTGAGFTVSGETFPLTLNPGQTAILNVQFDPTTAGAATGTLTIGSSSSGGGTTVVGLSGTGLSYAVELNWNAPSSSSDPVAGYKIYRAVQGNSTFQLLNSAVDGKTTYTDSNPQSGATYEYYVTSVDASGVQSPASNQITVTIP